MRDPGWSRYPSHTGTPSRTRQSSSATTLAANRAAPEAVSSLLLLASDKGKSRAIDTDMSLDDTGDRRARRTVRPAPSRPRADVNAGRLTEPTRAAIDRPRSVSRRRYRLPSLPSASALQDGEDECPCCDAETAGGGLFPEADSALGRPRASHSVALSAGPEEGEDGKPEWGRTSGTSEEGESSMGSSMASFVPSLSPSSSRTRLFDSDDEDYDESPRVFSPVTPSSFSSSLRRKTSISKAATSDPLLSPSSSSSVSGPTFSAGRGISRRGRWVPAPSEPTSVECTTAPELPDIVQVTVAPSPPASPPRSGTSPNSRPSLLTKSLRSLSRLPNLTLPDLIPRLPIPESCLSSARPAPSAPSPELATLPPGWGPAERRRVLAAEPSHAADEARGFVLSLSLRSASLPISTRKGFPPAAPVAAVAIVDEVEAAAVAPHSMPLRSMHVEQTYKLPVVHEADLPPTDDIPPLPPVVASPPDLSSAAVADTVVTGDTDTVAPLAAAATPVARYISNPRHLLQLAIEFEMMRHAKIRGPLRQRAVIVRQATSPPRYGVGGGRAHEKSRLCQEVGC